MEGFLQVRASCGRGSRAILFAALVNLFGCGESNPTTPPPGPPSAPLPVVSVQVVPASVAFTWVPQRQQLTVTATDRNGTVVGGITPSFSSSDLSIVSVDASGRAQAVALGGTSIVVTVNGVSVTVPVTVRQDALAGSDHAVAFVHATVLPMDSEVRLGGHTVLVAGGWIREIGPDGTVSIPSTALQIDATGMFLMPGLVDAHTHPVFEQDLLPYVVSGVTTIVHMGAFPSRDNDLLAWRSEVEQGARVGPTLWLGGLIDGMGGIASASRTAASATQARSIVRTMAGVGLDFVKMYNSLSVDAFNGVMAEASAQGMAVAAHGVRAPGMAGILAGGVGMIAHGEEYIYTHFNNTQDRSLIPSAVNITLNAGAFVTANLSTFASITAQWANPSALSEILTRGEIRFLHPRWLREWTENNPYTIQVGGRPVMQDRLQLLRELTAAMSNAGVRIILGTDSPGIPGLFPGFSIHDDIRLLVESGLSPYEAIAAGTRNAGDFLRSFFLGSQPVGTIRVGARADLILLQGDPLVDLTNLRRRAGVMLRGRWLPEETLVDMMEGLASGG